ncbi:alpha/beta fold hydrolase [Bacillus rugosus]|uniref:Alpha/beta hydrolase n=1 Tax=Bacillus rugosus TaxID=2715209 RepID=A0ACD3ZV43_9BACI|nr:alpha/beta hydrolase [Bacillus rugosus]UPV77742.1 alpha/beta hydrolase [Bacillus rugosus]
MTDSYKLPGKDGYFTTSDGVKLHYVRKGIGEPLIIIPGWAGSAYSFYYNIDDLSQKFSVYILESRAHGESEAVEHGYRLSRIAKDAREFFLSINVKKAHWMGHSMGCSVLWMYIDLFGQDSIDHLILVDQPPFLLGNPENTEAEIKEHGGQRIDLWQIYNAFQHSWEEGLKVFSRFFDLELSNKYENHDREEILARAFACHKTHRILGKLLLDHLTQDWRDIIPRITVPTLYITGDVSHATNLDSSIWIVDAIGDCKWIRFSSEEYGTHSMMINAPEKFNREVIKFLTES